MAKFFISCPLNFESICAQELSLKWPMYYAIELPNFNILKGGIEIECDLEHGLGLNHILKTSTRILLRLKEQKCRDIPKLYNIIKKFNWKLYLKRESANWSISTSKSRLINTKKIEDACVDGLKDYFKSSALAQKVKENPVYTEQSIFIRIDNDLLSISLDTSGDLLYIRGDRSFRGHASLRENFASSLLIKLLGTRPLKASILDPMCGTATFISEAKNFFNPLEREFAYYNWNEKIKINSIESIWDFKYFARDIDSNIVDKINIGDINIKSMDLFNDSDDLNEIDYIILNPPYGKRVKIDKSPTEYFKKLLQTLTLKYKFKKLGVLIPETIHLREKSFNGYKIKERFNFNNNGIKINFFILAK